MLLLHGFYIAASPQINFCGWTYKMFYFIQSGLYNVGQQTLSKGRENSWVNEQKEFRLTSLFLHKSTLHIPLFYGLYKYILGLQVVLFRTKSFLTHLFRATLCKTCSSDKPSYPRNDTHFLMQNEVYSCMGYAKSIKWTIRLKILIGPQNPE